MAQNDKNRNLPNHPSNSPSLDQDTVKSLIDNQRLELQVQRLEKEVRLKELDSNTKLAEKSIEVQERILTSRGKDIRMTFTRLILLGILGLVIILIFLGFCLWNGKDQFAYKFAGGIAIIISNIVSFIFGRKSNSKKETNDPTEQNF